MNHLTFINNKIPFTVNLPNQPYVDDFSEGITHDCFYIGMNYIKVNRRISDGLVLEVLTEAQTMEEIESRKIIHDEGCDSFIIDAREHPWEAAYITGRYYHEDIPNYEEELGTTDFGASQKFGIIITLQKLAYLHKFIMLIRCITMMENLVSLNLENTLFKEKVLMIWYKYT